MFFLEVHGSSVIIDTIKEVLILSYKDYKTYYG